jgi:hypothetical protein
LRPGELDKRLSAFGVFAPHANEHPLKTIHGAPLRFSAEIPAVFASIKFDGAAQ